MDVCGERVLRVTKLLWGLWVSGGRRSWGMSRSYVACSVPCMKFSLFLRYKSVVIVSILCNVENARPWKHGNRLVYTHAAECRCSPWVELLPLAEMLRGMGEQAWSIIYLPIKKSKWRRQDFFLPITVSFIRNQLLTLNLAFFFFSGDFEPS